MKYNVTLNGKIYEVDVTESDAVVTGVTQVPVAVAAPAAPAVATTPVAAPEVAPVSAEGTQIKAPMPGTILAVKKNVGEAVKAGDVIVVLEAMKMENDIVAPCDGTVASVSVAKGATVETGALICTIA